jgi:predicted enzyme related to lactoylglutathione lyase
MANQQLKAKLVLCNVPTRHSVNARKFYDTLFGGEDFARSLTDKIESYFRPVSQDGLTMTIIPRQDDRQPITCYFAVDNLDETVRQLEAAGGKLVVKSSALPVSGPQAAVKVHEDAVRSHGSQPSNNMGHWATMVDPDGNYLGLIQLDDSAQSHFNARPAGRMLSKEQVDAHEHWKQHGAPLMR